MAQYEELSSELSRLVERMAASDARSNALAEASLACLQASHQAWSAMRVSATTEMCREALHATRAASEAVRFAMFERSGRAVDSRWSPSTTAVAPSDQDAIAPRS